MSVVRVHHEELGSGHTIILLHGWGVDIRRQWVETGWMEALRPIRRVVAIDCRGHGRSAKPHIQSSYSYAAMAEDVVDLMDDLGIATADVFGYSMGAFMAVWLLGHHPGRFTSVTM